MSHIRLSEVIEPLHKYVTSFGLTYDVLVNGTQYSESNLYSSHYKISDIIRFDIHYHRPVDIKQQDIVNLYNDFIYKPVDISISRRFNKFLKFHELVMSVQIEQPGTSKIEFGRYLYHPVKSHYVEKVKRLGIVPKTDRINSYSYPGRIYLFTEFDEHMMFEWISSQSKSEINKIVILTIDRELLKSDTKFYIDLKQKYKQPVIYSYDYIPSEVVIDIFK